MFTINRIGLIFFCYSKVDIGQHSYTTYITLPNDYSNIQLLLLSSVDYSVSCRICQLCSTSLPYVHWITFWILLHLLEPDKRWKLETHFTDSRISSGAFASLLYSSASSQSVTCYVNPLEYIETSISTIFMSYHIYYIRRFMSISNLSVNNISIFIYNYFVLWLEQKLSAC